MGNSANGMGSSTTAVEVTQTVKKDISDKVIIITGCNTGIGKETAYALLKSGVHLIMGCRDVDKMNKVKKEFQTEFPNAKIEAFSLDLGEIKSIDSFVKEFEKLKLPLHYLLNNAGVMAVPERKTTKDGFEYQNGINHLGHFRLTMLLLPFMIKTKGEKRIVCVSSAGHAFQRSKIDLDNFHFTKEGSYGPWASYGQSKASNVMFASELNRKLSKDLKNDNKIIVCSLHPGAILTELTRDMPGWQTTLFSVFGVFFAKSIQQGAATSVFALLSDEIKGGEYCVDCNISLANEIVRDEKEQFNLWEFSEKETKIKYPKELF